MNVLLIQFDGKFPNIALMRISSHHKGLGDSVTLRHIGNVDAVRPLELLEYDRIYGSLIFEWNRIVAKRVLAYRPDAIIGGSGWDEIPNVADSGLVYIGARREAATVSQLEDHGIFTKEKDYSLYPTFQSSIGFTQRGCRKHCGFCKVPVIEPEMRQDESITGIWRGEGHPKNLIIWDNDTFGAPKWRETFKSIIDGGYRVSFNQGINARLMNEEQAEIFAATPCYSDDFKVRRWYTAWDNKDDETVLFRGLGYLTKYGVKPDNIMVYVLVGYWPGETSEDRLYRLRKLRDFGVRPYPMPYRRPAHHRGCRCQECSSRRELVGFQRWIVGAYDKPRKDGSQITWQEWEEADYRPEKLRKRQDGEPSTDESNIVTNH
jgi:hypothetical protein